jgi:hypothetical protein
VAHRLQGWTAIAYAKKHGGTLKKYTDPTERALSRVSIEKAERVAREDARLIYMNVPHGTARRERNPRVKLPSSWTPAKVRVTPSGDVQIGLSQNPMGMKGGRVARGVKRVEAAGGAKDADGVYRKPKTRRRNVSKRKVRKRVSKALAKYVRSTKKNPGVKTFAITIPSTRYDKGYKLTIKAKTKAAARSEAKRYCSAQWSKYTGRPASQYKLPAKTKVIEV